MFQAAEEEEEEGCGDGRSCRTKVGVGAVGEGEAGGQAGGLAADPTLSAVSWLRC